MKAIEITEFGAPEVLKLAERPTPQPKAGEVLIKVPHQASTVRTCSAQRWLCRRLRCVGLPGLESGG